MPLKEKILFSDSDKEKGDKESFLTALIDRDWSAVLKPALEKHNFQIVKKLHKEYSKQYPQEQEEIEAFFNALSAWSKEKQLKYSLVKGKEKRKAIRELTEYQYLLTHFLIQNSQNKDELERFWDLLKKTASASGKTEEFQTMRQGVLGQVATFLSLNELKLHPHLAHPRLDMFDQIDLQAKDTNSKKEIDIQIKSTKRVSSPEIFSSQEVYFPSVEINQRDNTVINIADKYFVQKNKVFQMHLQKYQDMIKKQVKGYLVVIPYQEIDHVTGQPFPKIVNFLKQKLRVPKASKYKQSIH